MQNDFLFRKATQDDVDFIIEAIIEAEKSGTEVISLCKLLDINENELKIILKNILEEGNAWNEWNISNYLICTVNNKYAGTGSYWIEPSNAGLEIYSNANFFFDYIPREKLLHAQKFFYLIRDFHIERKPETLQIENTYVRNEFRGQGLIGKIINQQILETKKINTHVNNVQIRLIKTNDKALRAYEKIGFKVVYEISIDEIEAKLILPANTRVLMEMII